MDERVKTNGGTGGMEMNGLVDDPSPDWETCSSTAATDKLARDDNGYKPVGYH